MVLFSVMTFSCLNPGDIDPGFIYRNHFSASRQMVHDLIGHGYYFQGGDVWIRFRSEESVVPKDFGSYSESPVQPAVDYFLHTFTELETKGVFPEEEFKEDFTIFQYPGKFRCHVKRVVSQESGRVHNYWFLRNDEDGTYYFRSWTEG